VGSPRKEISPRKETQKLNFKVGSPRKENPQRKKVGSPRKEKLLMNIVLNALSVHHHGFFNI